MAQGRSGATLDACGIWPKADLKQRWTHVAYDPMKIWSYAGRIWHMVQGRSGATLNACGIWPKTDLELRWTHVAYDTRQR
ncbi:hypothetical protein DPMN_130014 [Dreissena polymorpha]|uniref:Uncharacterized protein n=1 Tax=Dreissena polymorpha TaxID=45954 RepID=A0A9D4JYT0_DREPO|nr:hypothetical protein DPMN_130014 [Dreissena polymorpha]